jgi:hypothetical protein
MRIALFALDAFVALTAIGGGIALSAGLTPEGKRDAFHAAVPPDTIRWRRAAIVELRKLGIDV